MGVETLNFKLRIYTNSHDRLLQKSTWCFPILWSVWGSNLCSTICSIYSSIKLLYKMKVFHNYCRFCIYFCLEVTFHSFRILPFCRIFWTIFLDFFFNLTVFIHFTHGSTITPVCSSEAVLFTIDLKNSLRGRGSSCTYSFTVMDFLLNKFLKYSSISQFYYLLQS